MNKAPELLTVPAAAARKGVSRKTLYRALAEGRLTRHVLYGLYLIAVPELEAWTPDAPRGRLALKR
jgi:excisionase family DNA binding protein